MHSFEMSAALNSAWQTLSLLLRPQSQDILMILCQEFGFVMIYAFLGQKACQLTNFGYDSKININYK